MNKIKSQDQANKSIKPAITARDEAIEAREGAVKACEEAGKILNEIKFLYSATKEACDDANHARDIAAELVRAK